MNCYRFNKDGSKTVSVSGESGQLKIELYTGLPDALNATYYRGFNVFIHNSTEYPFSQSPSAVQVTPGFGTNFVVSRYFRTQYQKPFSDCTVLEDKQLTQKLTNRTIFDQVIATGYDYTQRTCILFCLQELYTKYCGCNSQSISYKVSGYDHCFTTSQTTCLLDFYTNNYTTGTNIADDCVPKCPLECTSSELQATLAYYKYPYTSLYVNNVLQKNQILSGYDSDQWDFNYDLINNVIEFAVYYDSLRYTRLEEEPKMTGEDLLGVLGGHLHLFLGMSLLSFVEIIELLALIMLLVCDAKNDKNKIDGEEINKNSSQTNKNNLIEIKTLA